MLTSNDPRMEFVNYYGNTSMFALAAARTAGPLEEQKLLSVGCLMPHLADYVSIFLKVYHNSMTRTHLPVESARLTEHRGDFFELPPLEVDCVISHASIHCFNDTRYGNAGKDDSWQKPYQAPAKFRQIVGGKRLPVIVSVSINREESFRDNNVRLGHEKFIRAFAESGFELQEYFFDYVCGGIVQMPQYLELAYRRAKTLPPENPNTHEWVVGNYHFK